jgi:hypothetical protein
MMCQLVHADRSSSMGRESWLDHYLSGRFERIVMPSGVPETAWRRNNKIVYERRSRACQPQPRLRQRNDECAVVGIASSLGRAVETIGKYTLRPIRRKLARCNLVVCRPGRVVPAVVEDNKRSVRVWSSCSRLCMMACRLQRVCCTTVAHFPGAAAALFVSGWMSMAEVSWYMGLV